MENASNSTASNTQVSVIIVSYNVSELLKNCLNTLKKHVRCTSEVIVIDNASTDNTKEMLSHEFPEVKAILNSNNLGFSAANNQGLKLATGKKIFFLNPDTEILDEGINKFFTYYSSHDKKNTIAGPQLLNTDGTHQQSVWKFPSSIFHLFELFFLNRFVDLSSYNFEIGTQVLNVNFVSGAALLIDRKIAMELNGFDENLFWMDDVDLCKRHTENGNIVEYYPMVSIKHHSGQSGKKNYRIQISNQIISKLKYYKKNKQYFDLCFSVIIFFFHITSRIVLFLILSPINNTCFKKLQAYTYTLKKYFQFLFFKNPSII